MPRGTRYRHGIKGGRRMYGVYLLEFDLHYKLDTDGSRQVLTK